ncbi:MAG: phage integrase N-terminal SAM-like domain-containing protein [Deltaproteobacteria bacterium]|nr:phage integrase N-terminal SAM-like domain-containing protein [Deltaproteobacteria bacterium]
MLPIPQQYSARFDRALLKGTVPVRFHVHYRKWLPYFLDFLRKTNDAVASDGISANQKAVVAEPPPSFGVTAGKRYNEWRCLKKSKSPAWDHAIDKLAAEIKTRHYSRKTLKTYADWVRKFQRYLRDKPPNDLSSVEVKKYLAYLAVQCRVASSTQNQAFNALLFLYRHVLKKDFGDQRDVPRAKKSKYIPVVLSRSEIDTILKEQSQHDYANT